MSDKLELEKRCGNMVRGVAHHSECAGMSKNDFRTSLEILKFHDFLKFFFHPESQIHIRLGDLKGSKLVGKHFLRCCGAPRVRRGCVGTIPGQV